ncbi:T-complex protein 11-like protein 1 [Cyphellophora attinorum]|uniref:T-complex protein 11-like protein 1 n=1 Tax=Cyphellophora attinorum TaxID=1664694 RepID=A0A0N0NPZ9_9EURO|nr:T-complex protein 11-like protein 1 [Phialophora attinorum]KPI43328.1 T-complex protein 11-like protein 1 [Phialophora attinorum]
MADRTPKSPRRESHMATNADDNGHCPAPPARVAARFVRNTSSRRRSSANSSRRSSISSLHSHYSNLSCHGGPRSTHIAQHLRRASIIETRKARLAERAAHAEQVRLRAAAAKAQPRASHSEEKAAAAQAAREKLLAEITARCEEEVRRAKRIAEENRERKAAEEARLREELDQKYAGVARRKTMHQNSLRRPRTASLAAVEEKKISPVILQKMSKATAARTIQRAYRTYTARKVIDDFSSLDINFNKLANSSFEDVTQVISAQRTIKATTKLLRYLGMLPVDDDPASERGAVRVFLSAYLILSQPMQALSYGGGQPQEQELMEKAKALIEPFESYIRSSSYATLHSKMIRDQQEEVTFAFNTFTSAFHAWKAKDMTVIIDVMIGSFVNLDLIIQSTKDDHDGRVGEDYLNAIRQEQAKIIVRLKRMMGPEAALNKIKLAVRRARRQKAQEKKERAGEELVPRSITPSADVMDTQAPLTPPATPRALSRSEPAPSSFITRLGQTMTVLPTNREIAHEIQINGTFEVQQQPWTESRQHFVNALRNSMRESMANGGSQTAASWTHAMVVLIRGKLMGLISERHPLHDRLDGVLDPKLIEQQCRNGAFSYDAFFDTIASLIAQLCSPGRDAVVKAFADNKTSDTIDRLFELINIIDLMSLDHINFQFRMASKAVLERGHEHEHSMFEKDLEQQIHTLDHTKRWWHSARQSLGSNPSGQLIYARAITDLVFQNSHLKYAQIPETLSLDYLRILDLRAKAMQMVMFSSILLTTKLRLQRNREALWSADKSRLAAVDLLTTDANRLVQLVGTSRTIPEPVKAGLLNFVARVLPPAVAAARNSRDAEAERQTCIQEQRSWKPAELTLDASDFFSEQIATFILKSLREHVFARLSAVSAADKARVTSGAAETLARAGMPEWVAEVGGLVNMLERVRSVDLQAHERWYDLVAADA